MAAPQNDGWETVTDPNEVPADIRKAIGVAGVRKAFGVGENDSPLPDSAAKRLEDQVSIYAALKGSRGGFKDDYAGNTLTGDLENKVQGLTGFGTAGQRDWWANFRANDNLIRNELFGAALSAGEQRAYEATTITPAMDPGEIRKNLERREKIVRDALGRRTKYLKANGYKPEAVDALLGEYGSDLTGTQAKGGDQTSGTAGAAANGSAAPPAGPTDGTPPPQNRDAGGVLQFADEGPQVQTGSQRLTDAQAKQLQDLAQTGASAQQLAILVSGFGRTPDADGMKNLEGIAAFYANEANRKVPLGIDYRNDELKAVDPGDGAAGAAARGAGNALTLGFMDEAGALADTVTQGGTYDQNLDRRRGMELYDEQNSGVARFAGQVVGGLPLGALNIADAAQAARTVGLQAVRSGVPVAEARAMATRTLAFRNGLEAAGLGSVYGFGNADGGLGDRVAGAGIGGAVGGVAAGALTLGGGRFARALAARRGAASTPTPPASAVVYQEGQDLGIDLPYAATGSRAGAIADQTLSNMPASANVMQAAGERTRGQVEGAIRKVASNYGSSGGTFGEIGDAAQRGARAWIDRFKDVSAKAYQAIPIAASAPTSTANSVATLDSVLSRFSSNPKLAAMFKSGELEGYRDALKADTSWQDLKDFRSVIGEKIGEFRFGDGAAKSDLRALYAGLSDDMKQSAAAQGPQALRAFERANDLYVAGQQRIEGALTRLLGDDGKQSAEKAGGFIDRIAQGNKASGDLALLSEVRKSIPATEWGEVAGSLISLMGQPANSQGRVFSAETFTKRFGDMAPEARNALFGNGAARDELEKFVRVSEGLARAASVRNTSNTAGQVLTGLTFYGIGNLPGLLGQAVSSYSAAKLLTNPSFVKWATGYTKMMRGAVNTGNAPSSNAINSQIAFLGRVARSQPVISQDVLALQQRLADAFGSAPARLAADERRDRSGVRDGQNRQQQPESRGAQP